MACERRYRDHDVWQVLRPDAEAEYQDGEHDLRFWLEWDRGTMNTRDLAKKFSAYARYVASRVWREDHAILPILLMVVPEPGQELRVARVAKVLLAETPSLIVRTTTATLLDAHGPLAPVWLQIHPHDQQPALQTGQAAPHSAARRPFFGY